MPKLLKIYTNPDPLLRKNSKDIKPDNIKQEKYKLLCTDMINTMLKKDGVGLAAPQIGKNIRLIAINLKDGPICLFNPVLTKVSWRQEWGEEGCLSVPLVFGKVKRHVKALCEYINQSGELKKLEANGLMARVLQHEIDHLDGVLFIDKAKGVHRVKLDNEQG
jgi:peptide deformylase